MRDYNQVFSDGFDVDEDLQLQNKLLVEQAERDEQRIRRAYKMGLLHGMNVQSMIQYENGIEDYGWEATE